MNEFKYAAKEPEGHIPAKNIMRDQIISYLMEHTSVAAAPFEVSDKTCATPNENDVYSFKESYVLQLSLESTIVHTERKLWLLLWWITLSILNTHKNKNSTI